MRHAAFRFVALLVTTCVALPLAAEQKYNPHTGKWETVRPGAELKYSPHSGNWGYVLLRGSG